MVSLLATVFHGELARRYDLSFVFSVGFARLFWVHFFKMVALLAFANLFENRLNLNLPCP